MTNPRLERSLFLVLVALHLLLFVFLVADRRMPRGHDTSSYYDSFRYPSAGTVSGPLSLILFSLAPPALQTGRPLQFFHAGLLLDEFMLLVGSWLLARRYYSDPRVVFFVTAAAGGSSFWADQVGHNFHSVTLIPLAIVLLHAYVDSGRGSRLFLAMNVLAIQALGQPTAAPFAPFCAFTVYAGAHFLLRRPSLRYPGHLWLTGALLSCGMTLWILLQTATLPWQGSGPSGRIPFTCGWDHPVRLADLVLGLSPSLNYTLYCGLLTVAFAFLGLLRLDRIHLIPGALVLLAGLLAFSLTFAIQAALFPVSPNAWTCAMPFVRLLIIFASGRGLELAIRDHGTEKRILPRIAAGMAMLTFILAALSIIVELHWIDGLGGFLTPTYAASPHLGSPTIRSGLLGSTALWAGLASLALAGLSSVRTFALAAVMTLTLQPLDVFGWKFRMTWLRTYPLSESAYLKGGSQERETLGRSPWISGTAWQVSPRAPRSWFPRGPLTSLAGINAAAWVVLVLGAAARLVVRPGKEAIP